MNNDIDLALRITLYAWLACELALQVRQLLSSAPTERTEWRSLLLFVVALGAAGWAAHPVARATPALDYSTTSTAARLAVLIVAWAGIGLRLWAIVALGRFFRGTVHVQRDHQVVRSGPYRWVRHPAYSGIALAGLALGVTYDNAAALLVFVAGGALALGYRIRVEEKLLSEALGTAYTEYAATTPRLIPGVW
ncbi:methyltransferase family protein [Streptomyces sp. WM6378]|uniref:methyltransferase family protein n=1 Tax=Streptomyces sp. WM6378 TaxID=1415557 RepID=UPI0006AFADDD|nr:isoprenylcysteine carboxylmethyltransferase family protein [Streptomyces sp. WM6378]KOU45152.1 isoprenylcysteine carboxyl methyltransferase [Streptomyces sp. WM6378]